MYGPDVNTPGSFAANCLSPDACRNGASVSSSSTCEAGTSTATCPTRSGPRPRPSINPRRCWPISRRGLLEDPRPVGGRVRTHRLLPGQARPRQLRPGSPPRCFHGLARRRRHQARDQLRQDRRLLVQHRGEPRGGPRSPCHDAPPARAGSREERLPAPRSRLPSHGRPRSRHDRPDLPDGFGPAPRPWAFSFKNRLIFEWSLIRFGRIVP